MYWRRFAMSSIPLDDPEKFDLWLRQKWTEKDALMEQYVITRRFPESEDLAIDAVDPTNSPLVGTGIKGRFIETEVKPAHWWEFLQIFMVLAAFGLVANILARLWNMVIYGRAGQG